MANYIILEGRESALYKLCRWVDGIDKHFTGDAVYTLLRRNNVNTITDLMNIDDDKLRKFRGVGPARLKVLLLAKQCAISGLERDEL